jgi:carbamoyltransferase
MLFNTSFNLAGEVIVETEDEAVDVLKRSKIEYLYMPEKQKIIVSKN